MLHHIAIATVNIEAMKQFYLSVPGFIHSKDNYYKDNSLRSCWFLIEGTDSILMIEKEDVCIAPFALVLSYKLSDLNRIQIFLETHSIIRRTEYTIYFSDPDGNTLGYSSYPEYFY
jgi:catechol 2,3-dioxygenase-like lactoylglutathione lyase family enzyme